MVLFIIKHLAESQVLASLSVEYPFMFNIPGLVSLYPFLSNTTNLEWYSLGFTPSASQATRAFIGANNGRNDSLASGMLKNVFQTSAAYAFDDGEDDVTQRKVPFFE